MLRFQPRIPVKRWNIKLKMFNILLQDYLCFPPFDLLSVIKYNMKGNICYEYLFIWVRILGTDNSEWGGGYSWANNYPVWKMKPNSVWVFPRQVEEPGHSAAITVIFLALWNIMLNYGNHKSKSFSVRLDFWLQDFESQESKSRIKTFVADFQLDVLPGTGRKVCGGWVVGWQWI